MFIGIHCIAGRIVRFNTGGEMSDFQQNGVFSESAEGKLRIEAKTEKPLDAQPPAVVKFPADGVCGVIT